MKAGFVAVTVLTAAVLFVPSPAAAQRRAAPRGGGAVVGHAVPRPYYPSRGFVAPPHGIAPYRLYYPYRPYGYPYRSFYYPYRSVFSIGFYAGFPGYYYYGYPFGYGGFGFGIGLGYGYPYGYAYPSYGYGYPGYYPGGYVLVAPGHPYGSVRIEGAPRDAQVFADGYYVGTVDDFDGIFQHLNLEAGPHRIEIRAPGAQPIAFDVNVRAGETITYRANIR